MEQQEIHFGSLWKVDAVGFGEMSSRLGGTFAFLADKEGKLHI